ncbi:alpha/beta fold hydrolase [Streptomyces sp. NPDC059832]|uniref:alpha/beta fold hydrolase n=1 Tax=Streptomyces sp. NPDC059832 TaxID=3346966 RepID=UPI003657C619
MNKTETEILEVPGAQLHYEVRGTGPLLLMIPGAPADAGAPAGLADGLSDRCTVVTYDQRGLSRSPLTGPAGDRTVAAFSQDAHRLIAALTDEPAYVLGTSGGALTGLDLATRHPAQIRALIAHEPPIPELLPDAAHWCRTFHEVHNTYRNQGPEAAMQRFVATIDGDADAPLPEMPDFSQMSPEALEMMGRIQGNLDYFFDHVLLPVLRFEPDIAAPRAGPVRIAVGIGAASPVGVPLNSAFVLAERLDTKTIEFSGDHQGLAIDAVTSADIVHAVLARQPRHELNGTPEHDRPGQGTPRRLLLLDREETLLPRGGELRSLGTPTGQPASLVIMRERVEALSGTGVALAGGFVGLLGWAADAELRARAGFEPGPDWSVLYAELPLTVLVGVVAALSAWLLPRRWMIGPSVAGYAGRAALVAVVLAGFWLAVQGWYAGLPESVPDRKP